MDSSTLLARRSTRLIGISGSLRKASNCTAVLRSLAPLLPDATTFDVVSLERIPLYNADRDGDTPPAAVAELKAALSQADGLVVCSPEYNYGMPGLLKNAIDWASRPAFASPLKGKPVLIVTASPSAVGGARAQAQIREALSATLARPLVQRQLAIAGVDARIQGGRLVDQPTLDLLRPALHDLVDEIRLWAAAER